MNRSYFPGVDFKNFTTATKRQIEDDITQDFIQAFEGIKQLPIKAKFGVYVAYKYYLSLFKKIQKTNSVHISERRVRIPNYGKAFILAKASVRNQFNLL